MLKWLDYASNEDYRFYYSYNSVMNDMWAVSQLSDLDPFLFVLPILMDSTEPCVLPVNAVSMWDDVFFYLSITCTCPATNPTLKQSCVSWAICFYLNL